MCWVCASAPLEGTFPVLAILDGEADAPGKSETALRNGLPQLGLGGSLQEHFLDC